VPYPHQPTVHPTRPDCTPQPLRHRSHELRYEGTCQQPQRRGPGRARTQPASGNQAGNNDLSTKRSPPASNRTPCQKAEAPACGYTVNNPVDNHTSMRITNRFLWIQSWITKNFKWVAPGSCAARAEAVKMSSPFGNGHHLGATPGTWEEPGDRFLARVPGPGGRRVASARPGNRPASAARPDRAPPSHTWRGPVSF
jgi:hypothetical protein